MADSEDTVTSISPEAQEMVSVSLPQSSLQAGLAAVPQPCAALS